MPASSGRRAALISHVEDVLTSVLYNASTRDLIGERVVIFEILMGVLRQGPYAKVEGISDVFVQGVLVDGRPLYVAHELLFTRDRWRLAGVLLDSVLDAVEPRVVIPFDTFAAYDLMDEAIERFAEAVAGEES